MLSHLAQHIYCTTHTCIVYCHTEKLDSVVHHTCGPNTLYELICGAHVGLPVWAPLEGDHLVPMSKPMRGLFGLPIYFPCADDNGAHIGPSTFALWDVTGRDKTLNMESQKHQQTQDTLVVHSLQQLYMKLLQSVQLSKRRERHRDGRNSTKDDKRHQTVGKNERRWLVRTTILLPTNKN